MSACYWVELSGRLGSNFLHLVCAAWACGDCRSKLPGISPWALGSGKFGTPCERMQSENSMPSNRGFEALPDALGREFDEPHAVIANRHTHAATMIDKQPAMNPKRSSRTLA